MLVVTDADGEDGMLADWLQVVCSTDVQSALSIYGEGTA